MKFVIAVVGKPRDAALGDAIRDYEGRAARYWPLEIHEVRAESARSVSADLVRAKESARLSEHISGAAQVIACEAGGLRYTSEEFSAWLQGERERGRDVAFVVGGAFGLSESLRARARARLSLAPGHSLTSWRASCSPNSCIAPVPSFGTSRTTSELRLVGGRMSAPRVIAEPIGGGALSRAALDGTAPAGWFLPRPETIEEWRSHAEGVRSAFPGSHWLDAVRPAIAPNGPAGERLERAAAGRGVVVTTGQQPGLFGGPGYMWLKALSALAVADRLERELGIPVAPVFWAATDDADFDEASFTTVAVGTECRRLAISRNGPDGLVMAQMPLGDVTSQLAALTEAAGSAPQSAVLDALRAAYQPTATVGSAYVQFLRSVLEPLGISVLDSWHPAVRSTARPTLVEALQRAAAIDEAVALRGVSIERAGYRAQVTRVPRLSLVFRSTDGVKERVPLAQAGDAALREYLVLSPNVLLRPIVERRLLPTVAYLGGPGEIAYFAQVGAVAEAIGSPLPLVLPRWSATVVEPAVDRCSGDLAW